MIRNSYASADGLISGTLIDADAERAARLLVLIHGGGCNGRYFELRGASTVGEAQARGIPVLVLDRPGYGGNAAPPGPAPIEATAPMIRDFILEVIDQSGRRSAGVGLIGHSIGGAIAITIASDPGALRVKAIAVSGIGDRSPDAIQQIRLPGGHVRVPPPAELTEALFFDPDKSLRWQALASLRGVAEDWLVSEVEEVVRCWPLQWRDRAARVGIPVHLRLAEHERIWESGLDVVERMADAFARAPIVDAALLHGGGHLYEASANGPDLVRSQLDFVERYVTAA